MSSRQLAERRIEWMKVELDAARTKQQEARVALHAAGECVMLAEMKVDHAKMCRELEELREARAACEEAASAEVGPCAKKPRSSSPEAPAASAEAQQQKVEQARQDLAAAKRRLDRVNRQISKQRRQQKDTARQLAELRSAHRDPKVAASDEDQTTLICTAKTIRKKALRKAFLSDLTTAPCLKSLSLHLLRGSYDEPLPKSLLESLASAPARIAKLVLTFSAGSEDAILALLQRVKGHLEELVVLNSCFRNEDEIRRFWGILEDANIAVLSLDAGLFLRDVAFSFQPEKWRHLHTLRLTKGCDHYSKDKTSVLVPLIRATAASLRVFELPWDVAEKEREAVFAALSQCSQLEEVSVPCCAEVALLRGCAKLKKLQVHHDGASRFEYGNNTSSKNDRAIKAVAEFLKLPSTVDRMESLALGSFQMDAKRVLPIFRAIRAMQKIKRLSVDGCPFPEMKETLMALACLEELRLARARTVPEITPAIAPNLKLLELDSKFERYEALESWRSEVHSLELAFRQKNESFKLFDEACFSPPTFIGGLSSCSSSDDSECKCGAKDASSDKTPPECTCEFSSDTDTL